MVGTITENYGGWRASTLNPGKLRTRCFADRDAAATWLALLASSR